MEFLSMAGQLILALAIIVTLHELGHFAAARMFGIKVEKFFLFFDAWGIKLFSIKRGDTEYGVGWLPLGGYVKIAGMVDESLDKDQMNTEPEDWEFRSKPAWQRLIVMLAGVIVNFVLGIIIFVGMLLYYGESYLPMDAVNNSHGIAALSLGKEVGFEDGDKILKVNGQELEMFSDVIASEVLLEANSTYTIQRNGEEMLLTLPKGFTDKYTTLGKDSGFITSRMKFKIGQMNAGSPIEEAGFEEGDQIIAINGQPCEYYHEFEAFKRKSLTLNCVVMRDGQRLEKTIKMEDDRMAGFRPDFYELKELEKTREYSFGEAIPAGYNKAISTLTTQIRAFGLIFSGEINPANSLMGPLQLATIYGPTWDWTRFWSITALFSLILAFMNLLPIPALDGGHALFLTVEMIIRRPLNDKFMYVMQIIGMVILFSLMIFAFGNDIRKLFF